MDEALLSKIARAIGEKLTECDPLLETIFDSELEAAARAILPLIEQVRIESARNARVEALGWAKSLAWHHYGIAWHHLEQASRDELLAEAIESLKTKEQEHG